MRLRFSDIHILFISAYSDKEYLKSAISLQADGYLEKPIDESELKSYLDRVAREIRDHQRIKRYQSGLADLFARQQILRALFRQDDTQAEALALNPVLTEAVTRAGQYLPISIRMQRPGNVASMQYGFFSEQTLAQMLERISPDFLFAALYSYYRAAHEQVQWMCFAGSPARCVCALPAEAPPLEDCSAQFETLLKTHQLDAAKELICTQTDEVARQGAGSIEQVRKYYELSVRTTGRNCGSAVRSRRTR